MAIRHFLNAPNAMTFLGAIVAAIGVFSRAKRSKIVVFVGALIMATGAFWAAAEANRFEDEVRNLNNYIQSTVTGGNSFCRLTLLFQGAHSDKPLLCAVPVGKYPLYDVQANIVDLDEFEKLPDDYTYEEVREVIKDIVIGNLAGGCKVLGAVDLGSGDIKRFNVTFVARNGSYNQLIRLRRVDGEWTVATRIIRDSVLV